MLEFAVWADGIVIMDVLFANTSIRFAEIMSENCRLCVDDAVKSFQLSRSHFHSVRPFTR